MFRHFVATLLSRVNTLTGVEYRWGGLEGRETAGGAGGGAGLTKLSLEGLGVYTVSRSSVQVAAPCLATGLAKARHCLVQSQLSCGTWAGTPPNASSRATLKASWLHMPCRQDPTILGWGLANEPQCRGDPPGAGTIAQWAGEVAAFVKSLDCRHLVTLDCEGFLGPSTPGAGSSPGFRPFDLHCTDIRI